MHELKLRSRIDQELQEYGLRIMEMRLQYLESHSTNPLPYPALSRDETLLIMRDQIDKYKQKIKTQKSEK